MSETAMAIEKSEKTASAAHVRLDYHEVIDDERFNVVTNAIVRFENALAAHARDTAALNERMALRYDSRIEAVSRIISHISTDFNTRLNGMLWAIVFAAAAIIAWMATNLIGAWT